MQECPSPAVRVEREHPLDIPSVEDSCLEREGVIVRIRVRLLSLKALQRALVVQMVFAERLRHALDVDDPEAGTRSAAARGILMLACFAENRRYTARLAPLG